MPEEGNGFWFNPSFWIAVGACATAAVAIMNIILTYRDRRRIKKSLPRLIMENYEPDGHSTMAFDRGGGGQQSRYYALRVKNIQSTTEARKVRVRLVRLKKSKDGNKFEESLMSAPLKLRWASSASTVQGAQDEEGLYSDFVTFDNIVLGYVNENIRTAERKKKHELCIQVLPFLASFGGFFDSTTSLILDLEVSAENYSPDCYYRVQIEWVEPPADLAKIWPKLPKITNFECKKLKQV